MKKLFRGVPILSILSLCVVIIYAQAKTDSTLIDAINSQDAIYINIADNNSLFSNTLVNNSIDENNKKLVRTTGSVKATGAGASRGAFSATAYCLSGRTALGHGVRRGLIAADPRVLKLGSRVYVNAGQWSGSYLVSDTGGAIKGKKIDIWVPGCAEARKFGRRTVQVYSAQ